MRSRRSVASNRSGIKSSTSSILRRLPVGVNTARCLGLTVWCKNSWRNRGGSNMNDWKKPEFVEIGMDAEINCYSSALADDPRRILKQPLIRDDGSASSKES